MWQPESRRDCADASESSRVRNGSAPTSAANSSPTRPGRSSFGRSPSTPAYYFPFDDVRTDLLSPDGAIVPSPSRGDGESFTIRAGGKESLGAALRYTHSPFEELRDAVRLEWDAIDAWFEEDEQVYTHPRDPYTRVDILASSRHVRVAVEGV